MTLLDFLIGAAGLFLLIAVVLIDIQRDKEKPPATVESGINHLREKR
jgi:hypothetical protein